MTKLLRHGTGSALAAALVLGASGFVPVQAQPYYYGTGDRLEVPAAIHPGRTTGARVAHTMSAAPAEWMAAGRAMAISSSERDEREWYQRGYQMGRMHERHARAMREQQSGGPPNPGSASADQQGLLILLLERDRAERAMRELRQSVQEARAALQQGNTEDARQALDKADQSLRQQHALQNRQQIERSLQQAEQALQRGDRQALQQALQQARQAVQNNEAQQSGGSQTGGAPSAGSTSSGAPQSGTPASSGAQGSPDTTSAGNQQSGSGSASGSGNQPTK